MTRGGDAMLRLGASVLAIMLAVGGLVSSAEADPATDYALHCRGCHRPDGSGLPDGAPSFRDELAKFLWVPGGREYLIRVPGVAQSELSDARIADLLTWTLREFSAAVLPADFVPFSAAEIARHRHPPLTDPGAVRHDLVRAIHARKAAPR